MKKSNPKRAIYVRVFAAFATTYLVLMAGFSMFLVHQEKKVGELTMGSLGFQVNQEVEEILQDDLNSEDKINDLVKVKKEFVSRTSLFSVLGIEAAVFSADYDLIYHTTDHWLCSYPERREGRKVYTGYGLLNPREWFSEKEVAELTQYLTAAPKAKKPGDLAGYTLSLEGLWLENEMIIPEKIIVIPMYANTFDSSGNVSSAGGTDADGIVYVSGYHNTKNLPYYDHGSIQVNPVVNSQSARPIELRNLVMDQERLKESLKEIGMLTCERVHGLTYRYCLTLPYQNMLDIWENQSYISKFYTVIARDVSIWEKRGSTLIFVWGSCLMIFLLVSLILSRQTYRTYQKQEELERQRRETTNALAHDLKTPLSIISGYAQNLMENVHTEKREYYAGNIQVNVKRMDKIIGDMLELSRLESDSFQLKLEDLSLAAVSEEIMNRYASVCEEKSITCQLEGDALVQADPTLIARVIDNFFINAFAYTPSGGMIRIRITGDSWEIYNSGSSISEEKLKEIWLPYYKAEASRSRSKGTGLGLAITRSILELHQFSYSAANVEGGVVFRFHFAR